jgi:hypothetical protein
MKARHQQFYEGDGDELGLGQLQSHFPKPFPQGDYVLVA